MLDFSSLKISKQKADFSSMNPFYHHRPFIYLLSFFLIVFSFQPVFTQGEEKDPVQLFNQGQDAHEKGDIKTALKFYEEVLKIAPEIPEVEYQRGNALQSLERYSEAEKAFRRAIELRENWILPMNGLAETLVRNNKFKEAEPILKRIIELDPSNSAANSALAELYLRTNASSEVLKNHLQLLAALSNPKASIWAARGALEFKLGDKDSAKISLEKSLALEEKNSFALSELITILLSEKDYPKAIRMAEMLVGFYPMSFSSKILLAKVYAESGKFDESLKLIDSLDGQNAEILTLKNEIISRGTKDVGVLEKQLESDPKNSILLGRLCSLTRTTPAKALEYCRRASETEPNNISHAIGFGAALVQAKQFETAINLFRKILSFEQENYVARANLATALFELKRFAEAKAEYQWLVNQKPDLATGYYFLAITHDNLQEYTEAQKNYQKFLQIADKQVNQLEIEKVNLRLPILEKQIKSGQGKKSGK